MPRLPFCEVRLVGGGRWAWKAVWSAVAASLGQGVARNCADFGELPL
ncbi:hypothetical protein [Streptomyces fradiae]